MLPLNDGALPRKYILKYMFIIVNKVRNILLSKGFKRNSSVDDFMKKQPSVVYEMPRYRKGAGLRRVGKGRGCYDAL